MEEGVMKTLVLLALIVSALAGCVVVPASNYGYAGPAYDPGYAYGYSYAYPGYPSYYYRYGYAYPRYTRYYWRQAP
jgi:hypothetical protein